jgi:hypothetical protein
MHHHHFDRLQGQTMIAQHKRHLRKHQHPTTRVALTSRQSNMQAEAQQRWTKQPQQKPRKRLASKDLIVQYRYSHTWMYGAEFFDRNA